MRLEPAGLLPPQYACYYLYGEDADALMEAAEELLAWEAEAAHTLRVDVDEIGRIELEARHDGLFGTHRCHALVRNAQSATPKQGEQLLKLAADPPAATRLIICAPGVEWRKALHKRMLEMQAVASCRFAMPTPASFRAWLCDRLREADVQLDSEAEALLADRLYGMRQAARQAIARLSLYAGGEKQVLAMGVVGDLLGERAPAEIAAYCGAVARRDAAAIRILRRLLVDQRVAPTQILSWLYRRLTQLLLYRWYAHRDRRTAARRARLFGDARLQVPEEAKYWQGSELIQALAELARAEVLLKGASLEAKDIVLERLTLALLQGMHDAA